MDFLNNNAAETAYQNNLNFHKNLNIEFPIFEINL